MSKAAHQTLEDVNRLHLAIDPNIGTPGDWSKCAAATMISETYGHLIDLRALVVNRRYIGITDLATKVRYEWKTPNDAAKAIQEYDSGRLKKPVSFTLVISEARKKTAEERKKKRSPLERERQAQRAKKYEEDIQAGVRARKRRTRV